METERREQLAWAAGFFDGEGSICCNRERNRTSTRVGSLKLTLGIAQASDSEVLHRFKAAVGVGTVRGPFDRQIDNQNIVFVYSVHNFEDVQYAIAQLWPWLGTRKRQQAKHALVGWRTHPTRRWFARRRGSLRKQNLLRTSRRAP